MQGRDYILKKIVLSAAILSYVLLPTVKRYISYGSQHCILRSLDIFYMLFYILCTWRGRYVIIYAASPCAKDIKKHIKNIQRPKNAVLTSIADISLHSR